MVKIEVDNRNAELRISNLAKNVSDLRAVWPSIQAYMIGVITLQFNKLGKGGNARGVHWNDFRYYYIRSANFKVPAAGGVAKLRNWSEKVLGRKRGETDRRVTASSQLLQNDGTLKSALLQTTTATRNTFTMDTADKPEKVQFQHRLRPFQFFQGPTDVNVIRDFVLKHCTQGE